MYEEAKICIDNILQVVISLSNDSLMDSCILLLYIKNMNRARMA